MEKISRISGPELFGMGLAAIPTISLTRNLAGDVAGKVAPFGVKEKSEKLGRRWGMVGGPVAAGLSALYLMRHRP